MPEMMDSNAWIAWLVLFGGCLVGLAGIILPGIPGTALILAGVIVHKLMLPEVLSWWTVGVVALGTLISWGVDALGSLLGARMGGASRWGLIGAVAGALVGLLFLPFGLLVGPFLGAIVGELGAARRPMREALKSGLGAGMGFVLSTLIRLGIGLLLVVVVLCDWLVW